MCSMQHNNMHKKLSIQHWNNCLRPHMEHRLCPRCQINANQFQRTINFLTATLQMWGKCHLPSGLSVFWMEKLWLKAASLCWILSRTQCLVWRACSGNMHSLKNPWKLRWRKSTRWLHLLSSWHRTSIMTQKISATDARLFWGGEVKSFPFQPPTSSAMRPFSCDHYL